mmetsp:Transcript_13266/g.33800  ORF Transcript_13266/g.33800 Transcript_13266/m.33800 type:complete len:152 (-) Transcript_13266:770-1225(-)
MPVHTQGYGSQNIFFETRRLTCTLTEHGIHTHVNTTQALQPRRLAPKSCCARAQLFVREAFWRGPGVRQSHRERWRRLCLGRVHVHRTPHQRQRRGMPTTKINRKLKMMLSLITSNLCALSSSRSARSLSFCEEPLSRTILRQQRGPTRER